MYGDVLPLRAVLDFRAGGETVQFGHQGIHQGWHRGYWLPAGEPRRPSPASSTRNPPPRAWRRAEQVLRSSSTMRTSGRRPSGRGLRGWRAAQFRRRSGSTRAYSVRRPMSRSPATARDPASAWVSISGPLPRVDSAQVARSPLIAWAVWRITGVAGGDGALQAGDVNRHVLDEGRIASAIAAPSASRRRAKIAGQRRRRMVAGCVGLRDAGMPVQASAEAFGQGFEGEGRAGGRPCPPQGHFSISDS